MSTTLVTTGGRGAIAATAATAAAAATAAFVLLMVQRHRRQQQGRGKAAAAVRHVVPPRSDSATLYVCKMAAREERGLPATAIRVREATTADADVLWDLVLLLAKHLGESEAVRNSREEFRRDLAEGKFSALLVEILPSPDGKANENEKSNVQYSTTVASAIYYQAFSTWDGPFLYLEDIFVVPEHRGRGVGTMLFSQLAALAARRGYRRFAWESLASNDAANAFYAGNVIGATRLSDHILWRLEEGGMRRLSSTANGGDGSSGGGGGGRAPH